MRISDWSSDVCSSDLGVRSLAGVELGPDRNPGIAEPARAGGGDDGVCREPQGIARRPCARGFCRTRRRQLAQAQPVLGGWQGRDPYRLPPGARSEEHTSELQSLMRISYAVFCLTTK